MKRIVKIALVLMVVFSVFTLLGCSDSLIETPSLVIIAGLHSNSQKIKLPIEHKVEEIYSNFGDIGIIVVDNTPSITCDEDGSIIGEYNRNYKAQAQKLKKDNEEYWKTNYLSVQASTMTANISQLEPDSNEVDTLAAIQEAEKVLDGSFAGNNGAKEIIIFDTGLSTAGALSFLEKDWLDLLFCKENVSKGAIKTMLDVLSEKQEIPKLDGVEVTWYGLGAVANPQPKLSNLSLSNLKTIWGELLKRANAISSNVKGTDSTYGFFVSVPVSQEIQEYNKTVTPVIDWGSIGYIDEKTNSETKKGIVFSEEKIGFKKNSDEFELYETTKNVLKPYAANLKIDPTLKILLVGTTADPNRSGGSLDLSRRRVQKVKDCFIELGVPSSQIETIAWGAKEPFYDDKEWVSGSFNSDYAKINRSVILLPYDSPLAQSLLNKENNLERQ